jgi:hypothetical protein
MIATQKYQIEIDKHNIKNRTFGRFFGSFKKTNPPRMVPTIDEISGGIEYGVKAVIFLPYL